MNKIDQYLLEHIELNKNLLYYEDYLLRESHGYNSEIINYVYNSISPYITDSDQYNFFRSRRIDKIVWNINENDIGACSWFQHISLNIEWRRSNDSNYGGGYIPQRNLDDGVLITIAFTGRSHMELLDDTLAILSHELLHAYEDYQRRSKGKPSLIDTGKKTPYYAAVKNLYSKNRDERIISQLLYNLTSFERNANISMLYTELNNKTTVFTKEGILSALKDTEAYRIYRTVSENISVIKELEDNNSPEADALKESLVNAYNAIIERNEENRERLPKVKSFQRLLNVLLKQWHIFDKKWKQNINKMIYDLLVNNFRIIR